MFTAHDARNAKRNADARRFGPSEAAAARQAERAAEDAAVLAANPYIGRLTRNGGAVFYAYDAAGTYHEARAPEALVGIDQVEVEPHPEDAADFVEFPRGEFNPNLF